MGDLAISVVIPTYNRARMVPRAVASALAAIGPADEVIVVDDGSTDATEEALAPYQSRIQYVRLPNGGAGFARNAGVRLAGKPLVAFLDSDDEWMPDKLAMQRAVLQQRPDVLFCFTNFGVRTGMEEHRHYLEGWLEEWFEAPLEWEELLGPSIPFSSLGPVPAGRADFGVYIGDLYRMMMEQCCVLTTTLVVRRAEAGAALCFPEDLATREDWECYGRLARKGKGAYMQCDTAWQWAHPDGRLADVDSYGRATARLALLDRVWGADEEFLARHGARFSEVATAAHLDRMRVLIGRGCLREARTELDLAERGPLAYRILLALPAPVIHSLLMIRRMRRRIG